MAGERHGRGMASVNQTWPHCVNQMGKIHSKPLRCPYTYKSGSRAWLGSQTRIYFTTHAWVDSGSWHSTHGQIWLIGTRDQPDSRAGLVRLWALLAARHGRGTAWARHAMCESAFMPQLKGQYDVCLWVQGFLVVSFEPLLN